MIIDRWIQQMMIQLLFRERWLSVVQMHRCERVIYSRESLGMISMIKNYNEKEYTLESIGSTRKVDVVTVAKWQFSSKVVVKKRIGSAKILRVSWVRNFELYFALSKTVIVTKEASLLLEPLNYKIKMTSWEHWLFCAWISTVFINNRQPYHYTMPLYINNV